MSFLTLPRTSRLLPSIVPASRPALRLHTRRYATSNTADRSKQPDPKVDPLDPPAQQPGASSMISQEDASQAMVSHQPNYHAPVDHGTS